MPILYRQSHKILCLNYEKQQWSISIHVWVKYHPGSMVMVNEVTTANICQLSNNSDASVIKSLWLPYPGRAITPTRAVLPIASLFAKLQCFLVCFSAFAYCVTGLGSWCFDPSQPQRIISGQETNVDPSPIYSKQKSSNCKLFNTHIISLDTNIKQVHANIEHKFSKKQSIRHHLCWKKNNNKNNGRTRRYYRFLSYLSIPD